MFPYQGIYYLQWLFAFLLEHFHVVQCFYILLQYSSPCREHILFHIKCVHSVCPRQSPGGMLKREKTVVDVNLSDSMKEEVFQQLIAQQTTLNKKQFSEQKKREEQVWGR